MLRLLIGAGLLLMTVGFGAAGWQYWQSLPVTELADKGSAPQVPQPVLARQNWLISSTGGLVPQAEVRAFLAQERFVPERVLRVVRQANLADLLAEGEKLPEPAFLQVLADIRAPRLADGLCQVLIDTIAGDCAINAARVVEGRVDAAGGTAWFDLELAYRLKDTEGELPDLATQVLRSDLLRLDLEPGAEGSSSPDAALRTLLAAAAAACAAEGVGQACRPMRLEIDWASGQTVTARAGIAWLDPLPKGMFVAPPRNPATGG